MQKKEKEPAANGPMENAEEPKHNAEQAEPQRAKETMLTRSCVLHLISFTRILYA